MYSNRSLIFSSRERTYDAIRDLVSAIGDPYTRFLTPDEFAAEVGSRSASALSSAGVGLQVNTASCSFFGLAPMDPRRTLFAHFSLFTCSSFLHGRVPCS